MLALSAEVLACHADNFSEYALTLGKQSQGINTFKSNMLALVDKSKILAAADQNKQNSAEINLANTIMTHGQLHERLTQMTTALAADLNADYAALFNEKKYREMQAIAVES